MNLNSRSSLIARLKKGKQKRAQFIESHLSKGIAFQIRATRDRLGWSQERLAKEVGMPQNAISRLESMSYGKPTITTLKRLASAFDVGLEVRFSPFSKMADWVSGTPHVDYGLSADSLSVVPFEEEEKNGTLDREYLIMVFDAKSNESIPQACDQANIVSTVPWRFSLAEQEKRSRTITDRVVQIDRGRTITEATITTPKRIGPTLAQSLNETLPVMKEGVS